MLVLLTSLGVVALAQTAPPAYVFPALPQGFSQQVIISGTKLCPNPNNDNACRQFAGSSWQLVNKGGSGGVYYDTSGNLLIATGGEGPGGGPDALVSVQQLTPDGTVSTLLNFGTPPASCVQTSSTSLTEFYPTVNTTFSINPIFNTLYFVTVNRAVNFTWNAGTTTVSCVGGLDVFNGPYTIVDNLYTYATIVLTGPGI
jgi:hypothetical protein